MVRCSSGSARRRTKPPRRRDGSARIGTSSCDRGRALPRAAPSIAILSGASLQTHRPCGGLRSIWNAIRRRAEAASRRTSTASTFRRAARRLRPRDRRRSQGHHRPRRRAGREMTLLVGSTVAADRSDPSLARLVAKAWARREALVSSKAPSLTAFAAEQRIRHRRCSRAGLPARSQDNPYCQNGPGRQGGQSAARLAFPTPSAAEVLARVAGKPGLSWAARARTGIVRVKQTGWLGRQDSNLGMAVPKTAALPLGYAPSVAWALNRRQPPPP